jgi:hypothetical protein
MTIKRISFVSLLTPILAVFLIWGCSSAPTLETSKIRQWGPELETEFPGEEPGLAIYNRGKYQLYYLAASHENSLTSPTLKLVEKLFTKYDFDVLLVESVPNSSGESPKWFLEESKKGLKSDFILGGESAWGVILADKRGIPFFAGEPDHQDIYSYLKKSGYTALDIIGFYTARQIPQWVRENEATKGLIERRAPAFISYYCGLFAIQNCPTLDDVKEWYKAKNGRILDVKITNNDVSPEHSGKLYTHKISSAVGDCRDKFTLNVIARLLKKYKRVAVIYGAGHYVTLRESFDSALGKPQLLKLNELGMELTPQYPHQF